MRPALQAALLILVATPGAAAWSATLTSAPDAVSLKESLLLAGALNATVENAAFGAPRVDLLTFDAPATIKMCVDQGSGDPAPPSCVGETTTGARLYFHVGGMVATGDGPARLSSAATAAALGGTNVTVNAIPLGAGVYAGGPTVVTSEATTLALRPLESEASIEVRGNEGFRTYNGTRYTLYVSGMNGTRLEARGAFVAGRDPEVTLARAGIRAAEAGIRVRELYDLLHSLQPPERADRRADLAEAFGPFQLVPPLLDGAAAGRANLTLDGEARDGFTLLRMHDLRVAHNGTSWTGAGNASYLVQDDAVVPRPGASTKFPWWIPILLAAAAIGARVFTHRDPPRRRARLWGSGIRGIGLVALAFVAGAALAPLLGFSPLFDSPGLSLRSRTQLALVCAAMVGTAWLLVGLAGESLARSAFAWRERSRALVVPIFIGLAAALAFLLLATPVLLSFVARFVRL